MKVKDMISKTCKLDPGKDYGTEVIGDTLYVYFHASWSFKNWARNFMCWTLRILGSEKRHYGYYREYTDMKIDFDTIFNAKNVHFVGYSRGGAIALQAYLSTMGLIPCKATIIGCPRLWTKLPNTKFEDVTEIAYGNDIVRNLLFWYKENPVTRYIHIPSTTTGWFRVCKDHGMYGTVDLDVEM